MHVSTPGPNAWSSDISYERSKIAPPSARPEGWVEGPGLERGFGLRYHCVLLRLDERSASKCDLRTSFLQVGGSAQRALRTTPLPPTRRLLRSSTCFGYIGSIQGCLLPLLFIDTSVTWTAWRTCHRLPRCRRIRLERSQMHHRPRQEEKSKHNGRHVGLPDPQVT